MSQNIKQIIQQQYTMCAKDPVFFMKQYCYIQHPKRGKIKFNLYPFQEDSLIVLDSVQISKQDSIITYQKNVITDLEKKIDLLQPKWHDKKSVWFGFGFLSTLGTGILINQIIK